MNICDRYYLNLDCPIFDTYLLVCVLETNPRSYLYMTLSISGFDFKEKYKKQN